MPESPAASVTAPLGAMRRTRLVAKSAMTTLPAGSTVSAWRVLGPMMMGSCASTPTPVAVQATPIAVVEIVVTTPLVLTVRSELLSLTM